jgi:hypothetical protein
MGDSVAYWIGRCLAWALLACPAVFFLLRAVGASPLSRRLANAALFCGLAAFCLPELTLGLTPVAEPTLFRAVAVARLGLALAGVSFGTAAFVVRRRDHGTRLARPLFGVLFSLWHGMVSVFYLLLSSSLYAPPSLVPGDPSSPTSTEWVYVDPENGWRLTLPSDLWKEVKTPEGKTGFVCPHLNMHAGFFRVEKGTTEADFLALRGEFKTFAESDYNRKATIVYKDGVNSKGHTYFYFNCMEQTPEGKDIFVAGSVVWCKDKGLVVQAAFEGSPTMKSEIGKKSQMQLLKQSAEFVLLSIE